MGSGCGAVGRAVAYNTRGPRFNSSHRQLLLNINVLLTVCRKDENKEKRPGMAHLLKKSIVSSWIGKDLNEQKKAGLSTLKNLEEIRPISVTRLGEMLTLGLNIKSLWHL